ncbi:phosphopantothenoylcysteine decarboxylase isoform X3 [Hoplias malabaricus]|uniref:phosphopantothenoylcysteine decarboxylase isoform X3 n=1 Tax=Hoplias malabaricus TaxID=27720 RepID=UPI0034637378
MERGSCAMSPVPDLSVSGSRYRVLVGVTGSVAALKLPSLVSQLLQTPGVRESDGIDVRVVTTERATHFYNTADVPVHVYRDQDEWEMWSARSDPVLHIELRRWANMLVIAPLDANTLGKIASGICDNLLPTLSEKRSSRGTLLIAKDMCGPSMGHKPSSTVLSCHEHSNVATPDHFPTSGHPSGLWLCGSPLHY